MFVGFAVTWAAKERAGEQKIAPKSPEEDACDRWTAGRVRSGWVQVDVWGSLDRVIGFVAVVQLTMWRPMIEGMLLMTQIASEKAGIQRISSPSRSPFAVIVVEYHRSRTEA